MSVDHRTPEQKIRAMLAARGLPQSLFSGARLLEQQEEAEHLRFVTSVSPGGGPGRQRFRPRRQRHGGQK